jgi:TRAP-type C4-dicarboxylate transport system permease small subunit
MVLNTVLGTIFYVIGIILLYIFVYIELKYNGYYEDGDGFYIILASLFWPIVMIGAIVSIIIDLFREIKTKKDYTIKEYNNDRKVVNENDKT